MSGENEAIGGNGGPPAAAAEVVRGPATREDYAEAIREAYHQTVEGIFRMGDLLVEAKRELPHGAFGAMVEEDLPFSTSTARKLRRIARSDRLRNRSRVNDLPTAWGTLYELATLDDGDWERIAPHVSADMTRGEIPGLINRGAQLSAFTSPEDRTAREELDDALRRLPYGERGEMEKLLARRRVPLLTRIRVVKAFADVPRREREMFIAAAEARDPEVREQHAVQIGLQEFDVGEPDPIRGAHAEVLSPEEEDRPEFESRWAGEAMPVFALQALLRWGAAFRNVTSHGDVLNGLWAARHPEKIADDARRVAAWLTQMAERIEEKGQAGV